MRYIKVLSDQVVVVAATLCASHDASLFSNTQHHSASNALLINQHTPGPSLQPELSWYCRWKRGIIVGRGSVCLHKLPSTPQSVVFVSVQREQPVICSGSPL